MDQAHHPSDAELQAFLSGQSVAEEQFDQVERHLEDCDECAARLDHIEQGADSLVAELRAAHDGRARSGNDPRDVDGAGMREHVRERVDQMWSGALLDAETALNQIKTVVPSDTRRATDADARTIRGMRAADEAPSSDVEEEYVLRDVLGSGGMGLVYRATQTAARREVALKMLKPERADGEESRNQFLREAFLTASLDHPNIVPIHDVGTNAQGALFFAMKRIRGTPWSEVLAEKSEAENLQILMRVADAAAFAHARKVVHRDLKPSNVMLGDYGEVLVVDWGFALDLEADEQDDAMGGTPHYMAPEAVLGPISNIDERSDVYLLGAVLHEIATGVPPHQADTPRECLYQAALNIIPRTERDDELTQIARRAMAARPEDRFASVKDFQAAIGRYLEHLQSNVLSRNADKLLKQADLEKDYDQFAQAVFAYREALEIWANNQDASAGLSAARQGYARAALSRDDLDLAASVAGDDAPRELTENIRNARHAQDARKTRIRTLARVAAACLLVITIGSSVGAVIVSRLYAESQTQRQRADKSFRGERAARIKLQTSLKSEQIAKQDAVGAHRDERRQRERAEEHLYCSQVGMAGYAVAAGDRNRALWLLNR
ncbi:MAG: serine/threonine protein kinase, partial [Planctomycetales bacterium]